MQASFLHPLSAVCFGWFYYTPCGFFVNDKNRQTLGGFARRFGSICIFMQFQENISAYYAMQVYILMQSAGGPCRAFWAGRPKRRRAPPGSGPGGAQGKFRFRGRCRRRRDGEGKAPSLRELAKPSGFDGRSFFRTQKGSGSRFWEPLLAVISGVFAAQGLSTGASRPEPRWTGCKR